MLVEEIAECAGQFAGAEVLIVAGVLLAWIIGLLAGRAIWKRT